MTLAARIRTALFVPVLLLTPAVLMSCRTPFHTAAALLIAGALVTHNLHHSHRHYGTHPPGSHRNRGWYYHADAGVWQTRPPRYSGAVYYYDGVWFELVEG